MGLVRHIYPAGMLGRAIGTVALVVAASSAVAPIVATTILAVAPWPWLFAVNVPIGLLVLPLGILALPHVVPRGTGFDAVAAVLTVMTFALLFIGIDALGRHLGRGGFAIAGAAVAFLSLLARQRGQAAPMLPLDLLRIPVIGYACGASVLCFAAQMLGSVGLPFYLLTALGRSQVEVGALMAPWPVGTAMMAPIAGRLSDRWSSAMLATGGAAVLAVGLLAIRLKLTRFGGAPQAFAGGFIDAPHSSALLA